MRVKCPNNPHPHHCKRSRPLPCYQPNSKDAPALEVYPAPSHHPATPVNKQNVNMLTPSTQYHHKCIIALCHWGHKQFNCTIMLCLREEKNKRIKRIKIIKNIPLKIVPQRYAHAKHTSRTYNILYYSDNRFTHFATKDSTNVGIITQKLFRAVG